MREIERISDQLKRAFEGHAWHGPTVKEVLEGITVQQALARPFASGHTIWELVLHIGAWSNTIRRRLAGEVLDQPVEGDFPEVMERTGAAWADALSWLEKTHLELSQAIAALDDSKLDQPVYEASKTSLYVLLHGGIQHYSYHAGQIALLKKASV